MNCTCLTDLSPTERNGHTATCNFQRRKAERNSLKEKNKYVIPKVTAKRKEENKAYTPLRKKYLEDHPYCEIRLIGCTGKATQIHHCSTSHKDFLNTKTWKAADDHCHGIVERVLSASERRKLGLLQ